MSSDEDSFPPFPDYDNPTVPFWEKHGHWLMPLAVFLGTILLNVVAFPPLEAPEAAYVFCVPALLWAYRRPNFKLYAGVMLGSQVVTWMILLFWLHHATWPGYLLLAPIAGLWVGSWFLLAYWIMPRIVGLPTINRLFGIAGLAAAWVLIEWTRTWLLSGFPWLPLAASQWERSAVLQISAFTGAWGVSFILILMNLGFAAYGHRLFFETHLKGFKKRSQEFMLGIFGLLVCLSIHVQESVNRYKFSDPVGRVGMVQPNVPQEAKWDPAKGPGIVKTLQQATATAAQRNPDLILWPEAVTPWVIVGGQDNSVQDFVEYAATEARTPILLGSIGAERDNDSAGESRWVNGSFLVYPDTGLSAEYYVKRQLVPFGEYVPFRSILGWLEKVVPVGGDFQAGDSAEPFFVNFKNATLAVSPLICYEDTYPNLARESVQAGTDLFVVQTNNGWFGEGGAAEQHAAHSVLRAVETRRPVLRVGNAGWSGWIDEFGAIRAVLRKVDRLGADGITRQFVSTKPADVQGSIYFKGAGVFDVTRDIRWAGRESFYTQYGNWFLWTCAALAAMGWYLVRARQPVKS
ncbi:apolipoprotein N-acyltransferase [Opitutaceae bacterium]|nr:apolipoprotein N-acyltransferase [Opitutaceae bacterium]